MTFRAKAIALNIPIGNLNCSHNHTMSKHKATLESIGDHFLVKKSYEILKSIKIEIRNEKNVNFLSTFLVLDFDFIHKNDIFAISASKFTFHIIFFLSF